MALEQKCSIGEHRSGMEVKTLKAGAWDDKESSGDVNKELTSRSVTDHKWAWVKITKWVTKRTKKKCTAHVKLSIYSEFELKTVLQNGGKRAVYVACLKPKKYPKCFLERGERNYHHQYCTSCSKGLKMMPTHSNAPHTQMKPLTLGPHRTVQGWA